MVAVSSIKSFLNIKNNQYKTNSSVKFHSPPQKDIISFNGKNDIKEVKSFLKRFPHIFKGLEDSTLARDEIGYYALIPYEKTEEIMDKYSQKMLHEYYEIIKTAEIKDIKNFIQDLIKHKEKFSHQLNYSSTEKKLYVIPNHDNIIAGPSVSNKFGSGDLRKNPLLYSFLNCGELNRTGNTLNYNGDYYIVKTLFDNSRVVGISAEKVKKIK